MVALVDLVWSVVLLVFRLCVKEKEMRFALMVIFVTLSLQNVMADSPTRTASKGKVTWYSIVSQASTNSGGVNTIEFYINPGVANVDHFRIQQVPGVDYDKLFSLLASSYNMRNEIWVYYAPPTQRQVVDTVELQVVAVND